MNMFEDTLDWAAFQDEEGTVLEDGPKAQILEDHEHPQGHISDDIDETVGMGWVEFYQWLGY